MKHRVSAALPGILALFCLLFAADGAHAQAFPAPGKPIRIIIPFPPGNTLDIMARLIGPKLTESLGVPVVVDNLAGASGQIGLTALARAAPDGYTIGGGQGGNLVVAPHTNKKLPYDPLKDFTPIALSTTNYLGLVANVDAPFKTVPEMLAWAKANPGKMTVATNGEGGFPHLAMEDMRMRGGFTYTHVPYKGSAQIVGDLIGGQVQVAIDGITGLSTQIKAGKIRMLAITNPVKVSLWPDAAVVGDSVPGYSSGGWFGFIAPAGTPHDIVMKLNDAINKAMKSPDVSEKLVATGLLMVAEPPEYFTNVIRADYAKYGKLVKDIGFQPQ